MQRPSDSWGGVVQGGLGNRARSCPLGACSVLVPVLTVMGDGEGCFFTR